MRLDAKLLRRHPCRAARVALAALLLAGGTVAAQADQGAPADGAGLHIALRRMALAETAVERLVLRGPELDIVLPGAGGSPALRVRPWPAAATLPPCDPCTVAAQTLAFPDGPARRLVLRGAGVPVLAVGVRMPLRAGIVPGWRSEPPGPADAGSVLRLVGPQGAQDARAGTVLTLGAGRGAWRFLLVAVHAPPAPPAGTATRRPGAPSVPTRGAVELSDDAPGVRVDWIAYRRPVRP